MEISSIKTSPTAQTQDARGKNSELGKDDFLKLFVAQMQMQDPMNPTSNDEAMGQMAQFSTLEQITNVAKANEEMAANLGMSQSLGLLGRTVTCVDGGRVSHPGVVEKVVPEGGVASRTMGGTAGVSPASITEVSTPTKQESPLP